MKINNLNGETKKERGCRFNSGCSCNEPDEIRSKKCVKCGWNPPVSAAMLKKIKEKLEANKPRETVEPVHDVYAVAQAADGRYFVTKNGDYFLGCGKSKENAEHIAYVMNTDYPADGT